MWFFSGLVGRALYIILDAFPFLEWRIPAQDWGLELIMGVLMDVLGV